jgi:2-keto-4-pentenoate hydratase/2-oxohepta-3-ene-1,7-dioic acid hydratase (catechol pathway)
VIFNDITARDIQRREMRSGVFSFCKAIDTFCPLGPWIVTPDEMPDPARPRDDAAGQRRDAADVPLREDVDDDPGDHQPLLGARLLGRRRALDRHRQRRRGFSEDAASLYLKPGDVIEAEIERIGILRNPVISWQDAHGQPAPPRVRW